MNSDTNQRPPAQFIAPEALTEGVVFGPRPAGDDTISLRPGVAHPGPNGMVYIRPADGGQWRAIGTLLDDGISLTETAEQPDVLQRIDRAVANLCPCGAEPSEDFAPYCSYDCKPTHRGRHTISDRDGTEMRWRPDLVSEADDTGLIPYLERTRHGRYFVEVFQRAGTDVLHVRLDDDCRWVGADVPRLPDEDFAERYEAKLTALVRELENERHAVPAEVERQSLAYAVALAEQAARMRAHVAARAVDVYPDMHIHWVGPPRDRLGEMISALRALGVSLNGIGGAARALLGQLATPPVRNPPRDDREATLRRIRESRNSGPQQPARPPRTIDPRRGR